MSDEALLRQKLEFLELQLSDSKQREQDLQRMYDSLLETLDVESEETKAVKDLKDAQAQLEREHAATVDRLNAQVTSYEKQLRSLKEQLQDTDYKLRTQKLGFEEALMEIRQEALKVKSEKQQLEMKLRLQENGELQSREQLNKSQQLRLDNATKEIEKLKDDCEREVQSVRQQTDAAFTELRMLYEKEKDSLEQQLRKAQQTNALLRQEFDKEQAKKLEEVKASFAKEVEKFKAEAHEAESRAKKYEDELNRALTKLRSKLYTEPHGKVPRTPLDKTRLMSDTVNSGPEEIKRLRCQLTTCRSIIASLETNEKRAKEALKLSQEEVERLQRAIRSKANEEPDHKGSNSLKQQERLSSLLIQKDIEIGSLKRQIGELKGVMNLKVAKKPPTYSPRGHSRSHSYQRDYAELSPMFTLGTPVTPDMKDRKGQDDPDLDFGSLEEIQDSDSMATYRMALDYTDSRSTPYTQQSTLLRDDISGESVKASREIEQKIREMALTIKELQVDRDRAKLDAEKLLMQLKHVKLEWAVEAERYAERELELKTQLRRVVASVIPAETPQKVFKHGRSHSLQCSPR
mmetsp:Transcript_8345/g.16515  ORF Transcript_8345/g.16515 Transcript_8345/m.16515 type:complete len:575 (+) Transcript_8345:4266-5990(+)